MEGNKNAMYAQVGKKRGWTQGIAEETVIKAVPVPMMTETVIEEKTIIAEKKAVQEVVAGPVAVEHPIMLKKPAVAENPVTIERPVMAEKVAAPVMPVVPNPVMPMANMPVNLGMPAPPVVVAPESCDFKEEYQTHAMAFVKMQKWHEVYEPEQGFERGTLFAGLDLPFVGEGACNRE